MLRSFSTVAICRLAASRTAVAAAPSAVIPYLRRLELVKDTTSDAIPTGAGVYSGFDPTASSLHVGNLFPLLALARFRAHGHPVTALVGGGTGMIGDPSGRDSERSLMTEEQVGANCDAISAQITRILRNAQEMAELSVGLAADSGTSGDTPANIQVVNNGDWLRKMGGIELVRDVGVHFRMSGMLARDSVSSRLSSEQGMSFTEFTYQLFQAHDFFELWKNHQVSVQVGGSDQWGNIAAGLDYIRRRSSSMDDGDKDSLPKEVHGVTLPLLQTASGAKFGKSMGNAIWLDSKQTPPPLLYQFLFQSSDSDIPILLRSLTMFSESEVARLEKFHEDDPEGHVANRALARHMTALIHGLECVDTVEATAKKLMNGEALDGIPAEEVLSLFQGTPLHTYSSVAEKVASRRNLENDVAPDAMPLADALVATGVCKSRGEAKRAMKAGGARINNEKIITEDLSTPLQWIDDKVALVACGKKRAALLVRE